MGFSEFNAVMVSSIPSGDIPSIFQRIGVLHCIKVRDYSPDCYNGVFTRNPNPWLHPCHPNTPGLFMLKKLEISTALKGHLAHMQLTLP